MKMSIQDYLSINLTEFAMNLGYTERIKEKSTKKWLALKNPSTNDKILITDKGYNGNPFYMNTDDGLSQDKGNIINFAVNRISGNVHPLGNPSKVEFAKGFALIKSQNNSIVDLDELQDAKKSERTDYLKKVRTKLKNLVPLAEEGERYLLDYRGIEPDTLNHPLFKGTIKQSPVAMSNGKIIQNLAFMKRDGSKTTGINIHYYSSKHNKNQKIVYELKDSIYLANRPQNPTQIVYAESAVDILSYVQLMKEMDHSNTIFLSFEGNTSKGKMEIFGQVLNEVQGNANLISITDNDRSGFLYDLQIAKDLHNDKNPQNPIETVQTQEKTTLKFYNFESAPIIPEEITLAIQNAFELETDKTNRNLFNLVQLKEHLIIEFPNKPTNYAFLHYITNAIHDNNGIKFKNHKPFYEHDKMANDWNDVLRSYLTDSFKKKIHREFPNAVLVQNRQGYHVASDNNPRIARNISRTHMNEYNGYPFLSWRKASENSGTKKDLRQRQP